MMNFFETFDLSVFFQGLGIESPWLIKILAVLGGICVMGLVAWITYCIVRRWLAKVIVGVAERTATNWDDLMFNQCFFNRLALMVTPLIMRVMSIYFELEGVNILNKVLDCWIVVAMVLLVSTVLDGVNRIYDSYPVARNRPIKVFIQVIKVFVFCVAGIVVVSIILNKDLESLLVGLSAFMAILILVFKDAILGFVAGVQLIANKMVNIGDWIVMPSANADGDVLEISLTTVKVQNWDKTISTIPTYKMVSESFTNWRGMQESKGRRIKRSVNIDVLSIHYLSEKELEELKKSSLLKDYIGSKLKELEEYNASRETILDARRLTNVGTFREYMEAWINHNPDIAKDMTHMVRQLQPGPTGLPIEIYCFSARQNWIEYERVQADIFDHLYAVVSLFNLKIFQYPSSVAMPVDEMK